MEHLALRHWDLPTPGSSHRHLESSPAWRRPESSDMETPHDIQTWDNTGSELLTPHMLTSIGSQGCGMATERFHSVTMICWQIEIHFVKIYEMFVSPLMFKGFTLNTIPIIFFAFFLVPLCRFLCQLVASISWSSATMKFYVSQSDLNPLETQMWSN